MNALSFARPSFIYLLALLPILLLFLYRSHRQQIKSLARYGRLESVRALSLVDNTYRRRSQICWLLGLGCLIVAVAGPRFGKGGDAGILVGRDLIILLDLSKSMLADDIADTEHPRRWQAARAGAQRLLNAIRAEGGHRVGIVAFSAKPALICPLTSDYDHVQFRLEEFSPLAPPPDTRPLPEENLASGTTIGSAIRLSLTAFDPRFLGYQDLVLFSDGDGPGVESEIEAALREASLRQIPAHVVGIGDPRQGKVLTFGEGDTVEIISTRLQETVLQEIARRTRGEYYPSRQEIPAMDDWYRQTLRDRPSRELEEDLLPQPKDRSIWFVGVGLLFLFAGWWREG